MGGDEIHVGDMQGSEVVAIGRDAQAIRAGRDVYLGDRREDRLARRNRAILLKHVQEDWVEGVLERTTRADTHIEIAKLARPEAIVDPWAFAQETEAQRPGLLPSATRMIHLFEKSNGALLILGPPGTGKTVALLELARDAIAQADAQPDSPIPVVLHLSSWSPSRGTLTSWVIAELVRGYAVQETVSRPWIEGDELLLLLDGFDEVEPEHREACGQEISRFRREHGLTGLVVCCRSDVYADLPTKLSLNAAVELQPLTDQQIETFLTTTSGDMETLRTALVADPALRQMAESPLMLSVLTVSYQEGADGSLAGRPSESTPQSADRLFRAYVERMLGRRKAMRTYSLDQILRGLSWLARSMADRSQSIFLIEDLQPGWLHSSRDRKLYAVMSWVTMTFIVTFTSLDFRHF